MRRLFTTLALAAAIAGPALAQGDITADASLARDDRQVRSVFLEDMKALVVASGHTIIRAQDNRVAAKDGNGLQYNIEGKVCENEIRPGCLGININVRYSGASKATYEKLNAANLEWAPVSVAVIGEIGTADSTLVITRYIILDGGMTMLNVRENLANALAIAAIAADYVRERGKYAPDYVEGARQ